MEYHNRIGFKKACIAPASRRPALHWRTKWDSGTTVRTAWAMWQCFGMRLFGMRLNTNQ
ncbi:hypothetical protein AB6D20_027380 (plasmid) [Vibrio splendidus]